MNALKLPLFVLVVAVAYLLFWPTPITPRSWTPPPAPSLSSGPYAYNTRLKGIERLAQNVGIGPEGINVDAQGRIYAGFNDGRVIRFSPDGSQHTVLADTGGRPLGVGFASDGAVVVADAERGLLRIGLEGGRVLSTDAGGVPFRFPDDVTGTHSDDQLYFTDASSKFAYGHHLDDLLEHGANGRLLEYDPSTRQTRVLLSGIHFANGITVGPNDDYLLINETGEYRVLRYWLKGPKVGTHDVFIDNLPGFPDNISFNGRDRFWVALFAPRDPLLDRVLPPGREWLRQIVWRLPAILQPRPRRYSFAVALDLDGHVVAAPQFEGAGAYSPITSVREYGSWLYFGSLTENALGRLPLAQALGATAQPQP